MFYACLSVFILVTIMCCCISLAIISIDEYNFALYVVLLCIVGTLLSCACAIANPDACRNPNWYISLCYTLQGIDTDRAPLEAASSRQPSLSGLRAQLAAMHAANLADSKLPMSREIRPTITMLGPAVHIMHQVWRGMAWVTDSIENEDEIDGECGGAQISDDIGETAISSSPSIHKKLSTVIEHEDLEETSNEFASSYDIMV